MKYDFDKPVDRTGTHSVKLEVLPEGAPADILPLWVADMDFACAEPIIKALHRRVDKGIFGYTQYDNPGVKGAVISWFEKRFGWTIDPSWIFSCPGVVPAIALLINCLSEEGDGIIIQRPVYHPFTGKVMANKREAVNSPLIRQGNTYVMDFDDLERKFADQKNRGMILCSPHNPVGRVWTETELLKLVAIAKKYGKWIISDEIHCDLTRTGIRHTPLLKIAGDYKDRIIACTAPSKTFNLAGIQLSNIIIPNGEYQKKWTDFAGNRMSIAGGCSPFGLEAMVAAYNEGEEWLDEARKYIDGNIKYIEEFVKEKLPKASVITCEGTYLVWLDLRGYCADHRKLEQIMIHEAKLFLDEGYIFGDEGFCYERINTATPRSNIVTCMERMGKALLKI
ncbi:MAG: pyridoxal phosphate-dependent aminotransferase [Treponema sp.]|nr:pyridoxal phosphate-dependent aminotransferase [Treponema sp.]